MSYGSTADAEAMCWSLCQPLRNDVSTWGVVAHMTSISIILFLLGSWKQKEIIVLWKTWIWSKRHPWRRRKLGSFFIVQFSALKPNATFIEGKTTNYIAYGGKNIRLWPFTEIKQRYHLRVHVTMWGSYDLLKFRKGIKNITAAIFRSIQCSILFLTVANWGRPGESMKTRQMVILHRIFSNIKGETQTPLTQNTQSQKSNYFQSLIS